ncbi:MAG TPA: RtcB family protein, partial [Chlamydiales bacterium]|nr:RtcB family protein [Chlamydiales bacterium]
MFDLKKIAPATYEVPITGGMRVPGLVIATEELMQEIEFERPLEQVRNVAYLPGIVGYSIAMPDIHWGYGFPIGGIAAMDPDTGVISPGGVGYDINCGVRLAIIPEKFSDISEKNKKAFLEAIFKLVPSGVGRGHRDERGMSEQDYANLVQKGAKWSVEQGY